MEWAVLSRSLLGDLFSVPLIAPQCSPSGCTHTEAQMFGGGRRGGASIYFKVSKILTCICSLIVHSPDHRPPKVAPKGLAGHPLVLCRGW